jgi:hypothetical protein
MLVRSKKSCYAIKCEEGGRAQANVGKNGDKQLGLSPSADQKLSESGAKQHRRPCTSIAFSTLKWSEYEQLYYAENKCNLINLSHDACKMTIGGEHSADGTDPTAASTAIVEWSHDSPLPWRSRSRSLSSVSSVSLPSVFSMDDDGEDQDDVDRFPRESRTRECWNVGNLLTDLLSEVFVSFRRRSLPAGPETLTDR